MSRIPDRKKQRQEYLKRKGEAYADAAISSAFLLFILAILVGLACAAYFEASPVVFYIVLLGAVVFGLAYGQLIIKRGKAAKQLPYIPPVTPDTLPAEEVLVRGSEQPP